MRRTEVLGPSLNKALNVQSKVFIGVSRNEQIFENYAQPNHEYFMHHGLYLEGNPYDCLKVYLRVINPDDPEREEKRSYLQTHFRIQLDSDDKLQTCLAPGVLLSDRLIRAVLLKSTSLAVFNSTKWVFAAEDELTVYNVVINSLRALEEIYDRPFTADKDLLQSTSDPVFAKIFGFKVAERELLHRVTNEYADHLIFLDAKIHNNTLIHDDL
eukprot:TRINITY_DN1524_c0_g3_i2.p2 TRINITY_DN1524_c0_g3~~TRINITY_DN1524_c0_g3_i2.p2  ORF type:complete len:213 (+),score=38.76 TRINITY_DN1524_c0_g3_i2:714-1352(+)